MIEHVDLQDPVELTTGRSGEDPEKHFYPVCVLC